jgi:hypothetical protein
MFISLGLGVAFSIFAGQEPDRGTGEAKIVVIKTENIRKFIAISIIFLLVFYKRLLFSKCFAASKGSAPETVHCMQRLGS